MPAASRLLLFVVALVATHTFAHAQSPADEAFRRGRELLKVGKYADACVEFEHSQKLDPALGTEFNIAQCSEKTGKLARALELYRGMLPRDTNAERKKVVTESIPKLEARVPHLLVKVTTAPPGFSLTIQLINSGLPPKPLESNKQIEIDFGEYAIVAKATGVADWSANVRIDTEAKTTTLEPPMGKPAPSTGTTGTTGTNTTVSTVVPPDDDDRDEPASTPRSKRKLYGIIAMGAGGAALVTGVVFGAMASGKWSEAKDVCGGTTCTNMADLTKANELGDDARSKATISTVMVGIGVAAAAAGVVLFVTAPSSESATQVSAHPTNGGAGITLSGRF